jgi:hypothetical protein
MSSQATIEGCSKSNSTFSTFAFNLEGLSGLKHFVLKRKKIENGKKNYFKSNKLFMCDIKSN